MSVRELVVLGTAGQARARHRSHNGYLLRWDGAGPLFADPAAFAREAAAVFDGDLAADLIRVPVPPRGGSS